LNVGTTAKQKGSRPAAGTPAGIDDEAKRTLAGLRTRLDGIDDEVLRLLAERYEVIREVQSVKQRSGDGVYVPERERAQLARLAQRNDALAHPLKPEALRAIFGEILSASRALQGALAVAYLGPAHRRRWCRRRALATCSARSSAARRTTASCRSRTRPRAWSDRRSTRSSRARCRSSPSATSRSATRCSPRRRR
jgi:chorismate mutase